MNNVSLYYFMFAAEELSLTRAAGRLFITQQSLSEHIRKLEKQYGVTFFERRPRLKLTYEGEQMLEYARKVLDAERELGDRLKNVSTSRSVKMAIGQTHSRGAVFMPTIFANFHALCPNVVLSIRNGSHEHMENQLRLGKIELYTGITGELSSRFNVDTLYRDKLYYIISRRLLADCLGMPEQAQDFVLSHRNGLRPAEACRFPMALPPPDSTLRLILDRAFAEEAGKPAVILETTEHDILFDVCERGLCGCFVSRELLYRKVMHKSRPKNVLIFRADGIEELSCFDIVSRRDALSGYGKQFLDCCRKSVREMIADIDAHLDELYDEEFDSGQ